MTPRTIILIIAALLTAGGTIYFAQSWISAERAELEAMKRPVKEEAETQILVAKKNMPMGQFVKPEDVEWRPWPKDGAAATYFLKGKVEKTALIGAVVRRGIAAGEPITEGKLARPGDQGFLAAVLEPGMRAVTVPINTSAGVAGFVFPGDRVDLLLTAEIRNAGGGSGKRFATETVLANLRVLAMDQRVNDIENTPKVSKTITFEVTPKQAEMIAVADKLGQLSLSLRSLAVEERPQEDGQDSVTATAAKSAEDGLTKTSADKQEPDVSVAADSAERQPPVRGKSVTLDSEASRLVGPRGDTRQVIIIRGNRAEAVRTGEGGRVGGSGSSDRNASEGPRSDENASDGAVEGAEPTGAAAPENSGADAAGSLGSSTTDLLKRGRL